MYPNAESSGTAMPHKLKKTSGSRQYPRIEADRASVRADAKCLLPDGWSGADDCCSSGGTGGAMREKTALSAMLPIRPTP